MARTTVLLCACAFAALALFAVCAQADPIMKIHPFAVKCVEECKEECKPKTQTVCKHEDVEEEECHDVEVTKTVPECVKVCHGMKPLTKGMGKDAGCATVCKDVVKKVIEEECFMVPTTKEDCKTKKFDDCKEVCKQNCDGTAGKGRRMLL